MWDDAVDVVMEGRRCWRWSWLTPWLRYWIVDGLCVLFLFLRKEGWIWMEYVSWWGSWWWCSRKEWTYCTEVIAWIGVCATRFEIFQTMEGLLSLYERLCASVSAVWVSTLWRANEKGLGFFTWFCPASIEHERHPWPSFSLRSSQHWDIIDPFAPIWIWCPVGSHWSWASSLRQKYTRLLQQARILWLLTASDKGLSHLRVAATVQPHSWLRSVGEISFAALKVHSIAKACNSILNQIFRFSSGGSSAWRCSLVMRLSSWTACHVQCVANLFRRDGT